MATDFLFYRLNTLAYGKVTLVFSLLDFCGNFLTLKTSRHKGFSRWWRAVGQRQIFWRTCQKSTWRPMESIKLSVQTDHRLFDAHVKILWLRHQCENPYFHVLPSHHQPARTALRFCIFFLCCLSAQPSQIYIFQCEFLPLNAVSCFSSNAWTKNVLFIPWTPLTPCLFSLSPTRRRQSQLSWDWSPTGAFDFHLRLQAAKLCDQPLEVGDRAKWVKSAIWTNSTVRKFVKHTERLLRCLVNSSASSHSLPIHTPHPHRTTHHSGGLIWWQHVWRYTCDVRRGRKSVLLVSKFWKRSKIKDTSFLL